MDSFFEASPLGRKRRVHYHRFMQEVHARLKSLQGEQEPLRLLGRELSKSVRLLCLDEFHIADIGDAMIMRNLLDALFAHGVALVTTSNQHPDALYRDGLQRAQFVPAIELIKKHMQVVELDAGTDYRLVALEKAGVFHTPPDETADAALHAAFLDVAGESGSPGWLDIEGRQVRARRVSHEVAWFEFSDLCDGPRGQADYIELARRFHTVLISGVPVFSRTDGDRRRRFTWLIDEFYDRRVKLVISAEAPVTALFASTGGGAEIDRTESRLIEMQTRRYLGEAHLG
jgi:cell division protein ZapE